jgi:hypothetical protein
MAHPNSLANLIQFQPGPDARRSRKGKGKSLTRLIKEALRKQKLCGSMIPEGKDAAEFLAEAIVGHAIKGNAPYMTQVMDRMEGKIGVEDEAVNRIETKPVIYIPDDGRDPTAVRATRSVPVDKCGHSDLRGSSGGRKDVGSPDQSPPPHQNGQGLRGGDFSANGAGDHQ